MTQLYSPSRPRVPPASTHDLNAHVEHAVDLAAELFEVPTVQSVSFLPKDWSADGFRQLQLITSQRSISALAKRSATENITLSPNSAVVARGPSLFLSDDVKQVVVSPDGTKLAQFRVVPRKEGKEAKTVIEIYTGKGERKIEEVEVTREHGDVYLDATFGIPSWHPDSHALVYTAEAPLPKPDDSPNTRPSQAKFRYTPDFGETFTSKREPTLFLVVLSSSPYRAALGPSAQDEKARPSVHRLTFPETGGESTYFGQPVFLPDSPSTLTPRLLATGYSSLADGRKLGIVYCTNRPARIYELRLGAVSSKPSEGNPNSREGDEDDKIAYRATNVTPLSPEHRSARSARVYVPRPSVGAQSKDLPSMVVYLSNCLGGPHSSCASLHLVTFPSSSASSPISKELVSSVSKPNTIDDFPGLYVDQLPVEAFVSLEKTGPAIVLSSIWRSRRVPLLIDLGTGRVTTLAPWPKASEDDAVLPYLQNEDELDGFTVLGTDGEGKVVANRSGSARVPKVVVADLAKCVEEGKVEWKPVRETALSQRLTDALACLSSTVLPLPKFLPSELVLLSPIAIDPAAPTSFNLPPLIVIPHGGPHSTTVTDFNVSSACLALAGYRIAHVNYPGSLGFGQDFVDVLPPQLGKLEVEATLGAGHYLNTLSLASGTKGKRLLMGGSHGGWTAAHLTSRWPKEYDAVVMRNPVIDLRTNFATTDIPDWCYAEATLPYPFSTPPIIVDPEISAKLHAISPLTNAANVQTPTLLLVGEADRRVPKYNAIAWFHQLQMNRDKEGNKVEVEMLSFPGEGHPITNGVEEEWVAFEGGLRWLARFTDF
ncbi:hypothetical protein JCM1841_005529 [Sporobolomyces salmonicolor]